MSLLEINSFQLNPSIVTVGQGLYMTYKRSTEMLDILTTFILLVQVYYIGKEEQDPEIKG